MHVRERRSRRDHGVTVPVGVRGPLTAIRVRCRDDDRLVPPMNPLAPIVRYARGDVRLTALLAIATIVAIVLLPFAVYRVILGDWAAAVADSVLIAGVAGIAVYAARRGEAHVAGPVLAVFATAGCLAIAEPIGLTAIFWTAPVLLCNYLLAPVRLAVALSALLIGGQALLHHGELPGGLPVASFVMGSVMVTLAAHAAALAITTQRDTLKEQASSDALTGVGNRHALERCLADVTRADSAATLAILDLDHFKRVNDRHGHAAGDAVLVQFAQLLRATVRRSDRVYRSGGEEFELLLPEADDDGARCALHKVLGAVRAHLASPGGPVTVSIGAAVRVPGETVAAWRARADAALYAVKHGGRDGLQFAPPPMAAAPVAATVPPSRL